MLNHAHIPNNFLRHDIRVGNNIHLIFMTEYQITLLKNAATWYMDGTFRVIRKPFTQLYGIHVFVTNGDSVKQFTVAHIFMSSRTVADYEDIFRLVYINIHKYVILLNPFVNKIKQCNYNYNDLKLTCAMVSMHKISRQQKTVFKCNNHLLMELFDKYSSIDPLISISAFDLLMRGSYLINPSDDIMSINDDDDDNADNE